MLLSAAASAKPDKCTQYGREIAYPSIVSQGVTICFVYTETPQEYDGQLSRAADGVAVYAATDLGTLPMPFELPYAGTAGMIVDSFVVADEMFGKEKLFVVHSFMTPRSWEVVGDIYSVSVFGIEAGVLVRDENASRFFGFGGDLIREEVGLRFSYPFKTRRDVELIIQSSLYRARVDQREISASVSEKAFLYEGALEPFVQVKAKKYLIKGDRVLVLDATAGWCKVSYGPPEKNIVMWLQCKSLSV
jgi:hypothetical protein